MLVKSSDICIKFLYNYLTTDKSDTNALTAKAHKMKLLSDIFASYGGILAKISQILCMEDGEGNVFSDCKPYSQVETLKKFREDYSLNKNTFFKGVTDLDFTIMKSGSIGQVHRAIYNDEQIVLKIQYVGLEEQFETDLKILKTVSDFLFAFIDNKDMIGEITAKLYEELDYVNEKTNQEHIYNLWISNSNVIIPKIIPELCTTTIISSTMLVGAEDMFSFIKTSSQKQRNNIGELIFSFIYENLFHHGIFYSDIHYGNFLIMEKNKLCVVDFGCINFVDESFLKNLMNLYWSIHDDDSVSFYNIMKLMGILQEKKKISNESLVYLFDFFKIQFEPLVQDDFEFTEEWLQKCIHKEVSLAKEWFLPSNCVFLNKINFGLYNILTKLQLKCNLSKTIKNILHR